MFQFIKNTRQQYSLLKRQMAGIFDEETQNYFFKKLFLKVTMKL